MARATTVKMRNLKGLDLDRGVYRTTPRRLSTMGSFSPTWTLYSQFIPLCFRSAFQAREGRYDGAQWARSSQDLLLMLESAGVRLTVTGLDHITSIDGPCVIAGNHMSMLETLVVPGLVHPLKPITFTVKDSLVRYPIFKDILLTRDPIVVARTNPRADFQAVMEGGLERLNKGISIVVFPQSTRMTHFDRTKFNSIAAKLARRAKVPLVPMALRTDVWQQAKWGVKDLGRLVPERPAFIAFDEPIHIEGRGDDAHERTLAFIEESLDTWGLAPIRASSA